VMPVRCAALNAAVSAWHFTRRQCCEMQMMHYYP